MWKFLRQNKRFINGLTYKHFNGSFFNRNISSFYALNSKFFVKLSEDLRRITNLVEKEEYTTDQYREYAEQLIFYLGKEKMNDFEYVR